MHSKEKHQQNKKQPNEWERIFADHMTVKRLLSKIYKQLIQMTTHLKTGIRPEYIFFQRRHILVETWKDAHCTSLVAQLVKNPSAMQETWVRFLGWEASLRMERLPTPVFWPGEFHGLYKSRTGLSDFNSRHLCYLS